MIGSIIGNTYQITEKLGEGGMGAVYKGVDLNLQRPVAVKVLRAELTNQPELVERFRAEAITLARLNHPNIATLYSFLPQDGQYFMVMEFVVGETFDDIIKRVGPMSYAEAIPLFCQGLEGIEHAHHMGIVHRDIKPANLMVAAGGRSGRVKVMDFGIARILGTARMTRTGGVIGTLHYMSPEQAQGIDTDARSDIYSLGVLLYEMLTGAVPFTSPSEYELMKAHIEKAPTPARKLVPGIPPAVDNAVLKAMAKSPRARFQSAGEFRDALLNTLTSAPIKETRAANAPIMAAKSASFLNSLSWKHYAAIAASAVVVIIGLLIAYQIIAPTPSVSIPPTSSESGQTTANPKSNVQPQDNKVQENQLQGNQTTTSKSGDPTPTNAVPVNQQPKTGLNSVIGESITNVGDGKGGEAKRPIIPNKQDLRPPQSKEQLKASLQKEYDDLYEKYINSNDEGERVRLGKRVDIIRKQLKNLK